MNLAAEIRERLAEYWIPQIYADHVRSRRTRAFHIDIPERENNAEIMFTLLGIELKVGKKRFACPDLATARYLRVFARLGCTELAIPYDITRISQIADELEVSWQTTLLHLSEMTAGSSPPTARRARTAVVKAIRSEITDIGPGTLMPEFNKPAGQRTS